MRSTVMNGLLAGVGDDCLLPGADALLPCLDVFIDLNSTTSKVQKMPRVGRVSHRYIGQGVGLKPKSGGTANVCLTFSAGFLVFVLLGFSDVLLEAAYEIQMKPKDYQESAHWSYLIIIDTVLLVLILVFTLLLRWLRGRGHPKLWSTLSWWILGSGITIIMDFLVTLAEQARAKDQAPSSSHTFRERPVGYLFDLGPRLDRTHGLWFDVLSSILYVFSLAILIAVICGVTLRASTREKRVERSAAWSRFRVALPLLLGTLAAYVGSVIWDNVLADNAQRDGNLAQCYGAVNQQYFAQISQIIPLLLIAVGLEAKMIERLLREPTQRAITILTVVILCIGELLALSTLPLSNADCGRVLEVWHEYSAFVLTLDACSVALAMLVWALLITPSPDRPSQKFAGKVLRKRLGA